ncbi:hypothetical protein FS837_003122, partial [Tulasnella sp. UAMH 9824]
MEGGRGHWNGLVKSNLKPKVEREPCALSASKVNTERQSGKSCDNKSFNLDKTLLSYVESGKISLDE